MKIILGGSFDPVHNGHILLALSIAQQFQHQVDFLPLNGVPNYKPPLEAPLKHRLAMLHLIQKQYPQQIGIDFSETIYPGYTPSYLSLRRIRHTYRGALFFILGSDSLLNLEKWDHWRELLTLSNFIVVTRPDYPLSYMSPQLAQLILPCLSTAPNLGLACGQVIPTQFQAINCSSTMIRKACHHGEKLSTEQVPPIIAEYIYKHQLYQPNY
jgi:nicotinate-nucleotide adenylyltransferase